MKYLFLLLIVGPLLKAEPEQIVQPDVKNFHKVSDELYRSAQPSSEDMKKLEEFGIKTLINLRLRVEDEKKIKGTSLKEEHIRIKTKKLTYDDMVTAMKAFYTADKPALVHCRRGSDRTGCFVACYRMLFLEWSKEDALKAFTTDGLGYYEGLFPNLREFVEDLDIVQFRKDVFGADMR